MTNHEQSQSQELIPFVDEAERGALYTEVPGDVRRADEAYRQDLTDYLVDTTVGAVGVYATMDLKEYGKQLYDTLVQRNPGKRIDHQIASSTGGGWGNYGERIINMDDDPLQGCYKQLANNKEELHTMAMPDGSVEVRYAFTSKGYIDGTDRPGNILTVGFTTTPEAADALVSAATSDPRFMNKVVEAQVKAIGIADEYWSRRLKPSYGFSKDAPQENERVLHFFQHNPDASVADARKVVYGEPRVVMPAKRPELVSQVIPEADEADIDEVALTEEHKQIAREVVADMQAKGTEPVTIMAELAEAMYEFDSHDMLSTAEMVAGTDAYNQVFDEYFVDQVKRLDSAEASVDMVLGYLSHVLGGYVDKALEQGRSVGELGNFDTDTNPGSELVSMQLSALTSALDQTPYAGAVTDKTVHNYLQVIIQNKTR